MVLAQRSERVLRSVRHAWRGSSPSFMPSDVGGCSPPRDYSIPEDGVAAKYDLRRKKPTLSDPMFNLGAGS